jgi:hypothetical protein
VSVRYLGLRPHSGPTVTPTGQGPLRKVPHVTLHNKPGGDVDLLRLPFSLILIAHPAPCNLVSPSNFGTLTYVKPLCKFSEGISSNGTWAVSKWYIGGTLARAYGDRPVWRSQRARVTALHTANASLGMPLDTNL